MRALLLIDLQRDFFQEGALAVPQGERILPTICRLMNLPFSKKIATKDFHPPDHVSFAKTHKKKVGKTISYDGDEQLLWPVHAIMGTWGAQFQEGWPSSEIDKVIYKGSLQNLDSYSAFFDNLHRHKTELDRYLQEKSIQEVVVAGLATDYCVLATVVDALDLGYKVIVIKDGCCGVDLVKGDSERAFTEMKRRGARPLLLEEYEQNRGVAQLG